MRCLFFWGLWLTIIGGLPAAAQDNLVKEFSGSGSTTTALFKVENRWEIRWNARQVVSVAVMSADGTIVTGAAGVLRGSLFVPLGGQYYCKISDGTVAAPTTNAAPATATQAPAVTPALPAAEPVISWHLQVVELGKSVASDQALTVYAPYFTVPDSAVTSATPPPNQPPPALTADQIHAMVTIKGDNGQGTGFLMRSSEHTFVVTHLHLLAANPNIQILTASGAQIVTLSLKGAVDRDLALYAIKDDHYSYLPLPTDSADGVQVGDQVIIPDLGNQTGGLLGKAGKVVGMGPERIDFDNAMAPGCNGAPVIQVKNGNVVGLVTAAKRVDVSETIAVAWPENPAPGSEGIFPYFGLRLNGVKAWETYDPDRFLAETQFLKQFHEDTRCLDSYLNGRPHRGSRNGEYVPDNRSFLKNTKIRIANNSYNQLAGGADQAQQLEATKELLFDLEAVADTDVSTLQGMSNLYAFDQTRAEEELAYRKALKQELEVLDNNPVRMENIARYR